MDNIQKTKISLILLVLPLFILGCTSNDLVGLATDGNNLTETQSQIREDSGYQEQQKKEQSEETKEEEQQEETKEEERQEGTKEEDILDPEGAKKAEKEKANAEEVRTGLEEKRVDLKKELEEIEEKIEETAEKIAEKEEESVRKSSGKSAAKKAKAKRAKKELEKLKEKQEEEERERVEEIKKALTKEATLVKELEESGEDVPITKQIYLTSDTSATLLEEARKLIDKKIDMNEAIKKLNDVLDRGTSPMKIQAGMEMISLRLKEIKEKKGPKQIRELEKLSNKVINIAQSSAKQDYKTALLMKMDVDEILEHVGDIMDTSEKILILDPLNLKAHTKKIISSSMLEKESMKNTLASITKVKELAKSQDKDVPMELSLFEVKKLLETGKISDLNNARAVVSNIVSSIKSKEMEENKNIFEHLGLSKSPLVQTISIVPTDFGINLMHEDELIVNQRAIANVINGLDAPERVLVYAHDPKTYIVASTYNEGWRMINGDAYLFEEGDVYKYTFVGPDKKIEGDEKKDLKNRLFNIKIMSSMEIPLEKELRPKETQRNKSIIQMIIGSFDGFFFNQVYLPKPSTYLEEGVYHYTSCNSDDDCIWPSTCNKEGVCCSIRDEGGCEIYSRLSKDISTP